ncbi:hypothetical protein BDB01DRAFT_786324 [Pilobolus umbonatus]|nr:hypothetical protein BDB01DRAFT_786324 [Pilobolus umbonatus]
MSWYTYLTGDMHKCYLLRLQLVQAVQQLNMGYEYKDDLYYSEMKRRAFWIAYVIDQWLASSNGGERLLFNHQSDRWDCKWPQLEDDELFRIHNQYRLLNIPKRSYSLSLDTSVQLFIEMIKLAKILGCIYDYSISTAILESNLTEWLLHLPSYLDYGKVTDNSSPTPIAKIYRILYHTVRIMLNKRTISLNSKHNTNLSVCTTSANIIIHITEQMLDLDQKMYLYNIFLLSLTLATSMHLDATIANGEHNIPDRISLYKSISIIKDLNCSLLTTSHFDQLMDRFLIDRCQLELDFIVPAPVRKLKRTYDEYAARVNHFNSKITEVEPIQKEPVFNLLNLNMNEHDLAYPNVFIIPEEMSMNDNQLSWINFLDYPEASTTTCSPISQFSPSYSPSRSVSYQSLNEEDNDIASYRIMNDSIFVNTFL